MRSQFFFGSLHISAWDLTALVLDRLTARVSDRLALSTRTGCTPPPSSTTDEGISNRISKPWQMREMPVRIVRCRPKRVIFNTRRSRRRGMPSFGWFRAAHPGVLDYEDDIGDDDEDMKE